MIRYKLTDRDGYTRRGMEGETRWIIGVTNRADTSKPATLCTSGVIHGYESQLLAVLMNPAHVQIKNPRLFEIEVPRVAVTDGLKEGYREATPVREIDPPKITDTQRKRFAILCALEVYQAPYFASWARDWLSGKDRSTSSAAAANAAAYSAAAAAAANAAYAAAYAAANAAYSAAAYSAAANTAAYAAYSAAAAAAAYAAAAAANAAANTTNKQINFALLAQRAVDEEREG